jgi:hypothetical protein
MKIEDIEGVAFIDRPFLSNEMTVWAKLPFDRADPLYNERSHAFAERVSALGFKEGYQSVSLKLS